MKSCVYNLIHRDTIKNIQRDVVKSKIVKFKWNAQNCSNNSKGGREGGKKGTKIKGNKEETNNKIIKLN